MERPQGDSTPQKNGPRRGLFEEPWSRQEVLGKNPNGSEGGEGTRKERGSWRNQLTDTDVHKIQKGRVLLGNQEKSAEKQKSGVQGKKETTE